MNISKLRDSENVLSVGPDTEDFGSFKEDF